MKAWIREILNRPRPVPVQYPKGYGPRRPVAVPRERRATPVDLDLMSRSQLRKLARQESHYNPDGNALTPCQDAWMLELFPTRPVRFQRTAEILRDLARLRFQLRLRPNDARAEFDRLYRLLPKYAQWRRKWPVALAVMPGKQFRKHPPRAKKQVRKIPTVGQTGEIT